MKGRVARGRLLGVAMALAASAWGGERVERFDRDPGWDGYNNRSTHFEARQVRQAFGYSPTRHAGGSGPGEIGGLITPAAEAAWYARRIERRTLDRAMAASGVLTVEPGAGHVLLGFFNAETATEWRTANSLVLRLQGRGERFYAFVEYATSRWRAGGDEPTPFARIRVPETGRSEPQGFPAGKPLAWSLVYDPLANAGAGAIRATIDGQTSICHLSAGHRADGATFDRFGLLTVMKSADDPGRFWVDDLSIDGVVEEFAEDPGWEGVGNRRSFESRNVRPRFDFGHSPTHFARGAASGELGGLVFRGDCREPERMAAYGDRVGTLRLDQALRASGRAALQRGVTDSTTLLGFYHSEQSLRSNPSQRSGLPESFLGLAIEGPSREGFLMYPLVRGAGDTEAIRDGDDRPHILPNGEPHDWVLDYDPAGGQGRGRITLTVDGRPMTLDLPLGMPRDATIFNRFGLLTTWIDGNGQQVYFDDLSYTVAESPKP